MIVIEKKEALSLKSAKAFLVGKVLTHKAFNKEHFKRQMRSL